MGHSETRVRLTAAPAIEPVTAVEAKLFARIDTSADDALVSSLIVAAREYVEKSTRRRLITQTVEVVMDEWPAAPGMADEWWSGTREGPIATVLPALDLPILPAQSVSKIETVSEAGARTEFATASWYTDISDGRARIALRVGASWPSIVRDVGGIVITVVAGYGDAAADVPAALQLAIKMLVSHWYENREAIGEAPARVRSLLARYQQIGLA